MTAPGVAAETRAVAATPGRSVQVAEVDGVVVGLRRDQDDPAAEADVVASPTAFSRRVSR